MHKKQKSTLVEERGCLRFQPWEGREKLHSNFKKHFSVSYESVVSKFRQVHSM